MRKCDRRSNDQGLCCIEWCGLLICDGIEVELVLFWQNVVVPGKGQERDVQVAYWKEQTQSATLEAMMLDTQASEIDQIERPEVQELSYVTSFGHLH